MSARSAMAPYPVLRYGQTPSMGRALSGLIRELTRRSSRRRIEGRVDPRGLPRTKVHPAKA
jgi:hypothetical protein